MSRALGLAVGFAVILALAPLAASAGAPKRVSEPPKVVEYVDLGRYMEQWHQIAFFPNSFQKECVRDTTAHYALRDDGKVSVVNECVKADGSLQRAEGVATVEDPITQAKLKVKFSWLAPAGDYWIIDLGRDYEYSVVGTPDLDYLWILARAPTMRLETYNELVERARGQGFDISRLQQTATLETAER